MESVGNRPDRYFLSLLPCNPLAGWEYPPSSTPANSVGEVRTAAETESPELGAATLA